MEVIPKCLQQNKSSPPSIGSDPKTVLPHLLKLTASSSMIESGKRSGMRMCNNSNSGIITHNIHTIKIPRIYVCLKSNENPKLGCWPHETSDHVKAGTHRLQIINLLFFNVITNFQRTFVASAFLISCNT